MLELCTKLLGVDKVYLISTQHRLHNLMEHDTTSSCVYLTRRYGTCTLLSKKIDVSK